MVECRRHHGGVAPTPRCFGKLLHGFRTNFSMVILHGPSIGFVHRGDFSKFPNFLLFLSATSKELSPRKLRNKKGVLHSRARHFAKFMQFGKMKPRTEIYTSSKSTYSPSSFSKIFLFFFPFSFFPSVAECARLPRTLPLAEFWGPAPKIRLRPDLNVPKSNCKSICPKPTTRRRIPKMRMNKHPSIGYIRKSEMGALVSPTTL